MYRWFFVLLLGFMLVGGSEVVLYESTVDTSAWVYNDDRPLQYAVSANEEVWNRQLGQLEPPLRNRPEVDWETEFPILVYLGEHRSGGYRVEIDQIRKEGNIMVVQVSRRSPGPGEMVTMAFTYPMQVITLPKEHIENVEKVRFVRGESELLGEVNILQ